MQIGDLLVKVAKKEPMSETDKRHLQTTMNRLELDNAFINSLQDGRGNIYADNINAVSGVFRYAPYGLSSKIKFSVTVPSGTPGAATVTFTEKVYDELNGFTASSNYFRIPFRAKYQLSVFVDWEPYSGEYRSHVLYVLNRGNVVEVGGREHSTEAEPLVTSGSEEASLPQGSFITVVCSIPNLGVSLDCTGSLTVRLIRTHDGADGFS